MTLCSPSGVPGDILPAVDSVACANILYLNLLHVVGGPLFTSATAPGSAITSSPGPAFTKQSTYMFPTDMALYASFDSSSSQFLDAGSHTFRISQGSGFCIVANVRFSGAIAAPDYETVFASGDSASDGLDNGLWLGRSSEDRLQFKALNGGSLACEVVIAGAGLEIVQGTWYYIIISYDHISSELKMVMSSADQVSTGQNTTSCQAAIADRTSAQTFVGKSPCNCANFVVAWHTSSGGVDGQTFGNLSSAQQKFDQITSGGQFFTRLFDQSINPVQTYGNTNAINMFSHLLQQYAIRTCAAIASPGGSCSVAHQYFNGDVAGLLVVDSVLQEPDYNALADYVIASAIFPAVNCGLHSAGACQDCVWLLGTNFDSSHCDGDCVWNGTSCIHSDGVPSTTQTQTPTPMQTTEIAASNQSHAESAAQFTTPTNPSTTPISPGIPEPCAPGYYMIYQAPEDVEQSNNQTGSKNWTASCILEGSITREEAQVHHHSTSLRLMDLFLIVAGLCSQKC